MNNLLLICNKFTSELHFTKSMIYVHCMWAIFEKQRHEKKSLRKQDIEIYLS